MNLLFNTYTSNEFADGCAYAFLDLTPELAALILKRAQHFKESHAGMLPSRRSTITIVRACFWIRCRPATMATRWR